MDQKTGHIILLAIFLLLVNTAYAANYYVRPGATGANNGTDWTNAYGGLPSKLVRGATYYLGDGTYTGTYTFNTPNSGTTRILIKKATAGDHGTETGWLSTYGDGEALFTSNGDVLRCGPSVGYITIDGQGGTNGVAGSFGIRLKSTASRNGTTALLMVDTSGTFATSGNCDSWIVRYVDFDWNNGTSAGNGGNGAVRCAQLNSGLTNDNFTFDNVWCHHSSGFGLYVNSGGSGLTIKNSRFSDNGGEGSLHYETLWINPGSNLTFTNNEIIDTKNGALTGWLMIGNMVTALIANNLFYCTQTSACATGGNGVVGTWSSTQNNSNITVANNTFANLPTSGATYIYFPGVANMVCRNNLVYTGRFGWEGCQTSTNNACGGGASCNGTYQQTGITNSVFTNFAARDFHLAGHTTAGFNMSSLYTTDHDGNARSFWDIGAYEFGATVASSGTLTAPSNLRFQ